MKAKNLGILLWVLLFVAGSFLVYSCGRLSNFLGQANTTLQSTSLAAAAAAGLTVCGTREGNNWAITPATISGLALSILFPINGTEDDGVVVFGNGRPDIAPAQ
jgi:hypothetical protein